MRIGGVAARILALAMENGGDSGGDWKGANFFGFAKTRAFTLDKARINRVSLNRLLGQKPRQKRNVRRDACDLEARQRRLQPRQRGPRVSACAITFASMGS